MNNIKWFDTEREAYLAKRRLKGTRNMKWTVQANALVRIRRKTPKRLFGVKLD